MFAGKKSAQIREILISESAWEEMTCLFAPSLGKHPHVELCDLLKLEGWSESGAQAKIAIADGLVKVDGAVETRKRCKIVAGQTVSFEGQSVTVTA